VKSCDWCGNEFDPATTYQIYCGPECRKQATKKKIKARSSIAKIKNRVKKPRQCANNCGATLSIYNDGKICAKCRIDQRLVNKALNNMRDFFEYEGEGNDSC
jgi:hypothetical protein